jgi:hypothetical protein
LDRKEFRNAARDALQRHIGEKAELEPRRPDITNYAGRLQRDGGMDSEQRAAIAYNERLNREWFEHQRAAPERVQAATASPPRDAERENPGLQFKAAAREVTGREDGPPPIPRAERAPETGPGRPPPATAAAKSREALNEHIERTQSPARNEMRQAARESLQRHAEAPDRGQIQPPKPDINRPRDLDR